MRAALTTDATRLTGQRRPPALRGAWLGLARAVWAFYVAYAVWRFVDELPLVFAAFRDPALNTRVGMPLEAYAWLSVSLSALTMAASVAVALILFWRRSGDPMALVASLFLVLFATLATGAWMPGPGIPPPALLPVWLQALLNAPGSLALYAFFLLFPNGRFTPRWSWALIPLWLSQTTLFDVASAEGLDLPFWAGLGYPLLYAAAVGAQIYRYWRVSTPIERLQTKWVAAGLVTVLCVSQLFTWLMVLTPLGQIALPPLAQFATQLAALAIPLAFFISLQRYRLYEIDRIINQALVYATLSALAAALYIGAVLGLQALARGATGQDSPLALVASTLLIASLIQPLRRRIQRFIDRRFYRTKYDTRKTLVAFGATLRQEVSLPELQGHLLTVVEESFQPASATLWLAPHARPAPANH